MGRRESTNNHAVVDPVLADLRWLVEVTADRDPDSPVRVEAATQDGPYVSPPRITVVGRPTNPAGAPR